MDLNNNNNNFSFILIVLAIIIAGAILAAIGAEYIGWILFLLSCCFIVYLFTLNSKIYNEHNKNVEVYNQNEKELESIKKRMEKIKELEKKYSGILNLSEEIEKSNSKLNELKETIKNYEETKINLVKDISTYSEIENLSTYGFYKRIYDDVDSKFYKSELERNKQNQKGAIIDDEAVHCSETWFINGSEQNGKKLTNDITKLVIRAFNGECDSIISKVKTKNITIMETRIQKAYSTINKLIENFHCYITEHYFSLKMEELKLTYEYTLVLEEEKEEQRMIKEQMREEARAQKEYEKTIKDAEAEELRNQKALEKARIEYEKILKDKTNEEKIKYELIIKDLELKLEEARKLKERALSQAQLTRSGHVYIISNIGSFGDNVYKIGMTRRLDPLDRVKELGDASVPFPFDVHAMIYSEDAPKLEKQLHKIFNDKRVNMINQRREFFEVSLNEIENVVISNHGEFRLTKFAEAEQYRQTLVMKNNHINPVFDDNIDAEELEELTTV